MQVIGNALIQDLTQLRHDLRDLDKYQIFMLESDRFKSPKSYGDCTGNQRNRFAYGLFQQVEKRLDKIFPRNDPQRK